MDNISTITEKRKYINLKDVFSNNIPTIGSVIINIKPIIKDFTERYVALLSSSTTSCIFAVINGAIIDSKNLQNMYNIAVNIKLSKIRPTPNKKLTNIIDLLTNLNSTFSFFDNM